MGLRLKLLLPIVLAFIGVMLLIHFSLVPQLLEDEGDTVLKREENILAALEPGVARALLSGDLAVMYDIFDHQIAAREGVWVALELRKPDGKRLYPLSDIQGVNGDYIAVLDRPLMWGSVQLGTIHLVIDMRSDYMDELASMRELELILAVVWLVLLAIAWLLQERWVRTPLKKLEQAAGRLAVGDYESQLPSAGRDDIGQLISAFADMRRQLQISQQRLVQARDEAERANWAKSHFLSRMSHELRTPMNAILGFSQLLVYELEVPAQKESLEEIIKAGRHLLELINDVLDLAKIESGSVEIKREEVGAMGVVADSLALVQGLARNHGIELIDQTAAADGYVIDVDETQVKQVLINLLSNAIKYNRPNGRVMFSCEPQINGRLRFSVIDTGPGLTQEQQQRLFNPFDRLGAEYGEIEGTGIGLVITKRLVEGMGGELGVISEQGTGSTFWVEVNGRRAEQQRELGSVEKSPEVDPGPVEPAGNGRQITVLYIEDNEANLRLVEQIIKRCTDYILISASDARKGIALARERKPDLILMDVHLPGMDGFAATTQLKALEETRDIPVIGVSANAMASAIQEGMNLGFADYLTKPFRVDAFLESIQRVLGETNNG